MTSSGLEAEVFSTNNNPGPRIRSIAGPFLLQRFERQVTSSHRQPTTARKPLG